MDNGLQPYEPNPDPATQAFVRLEREMALLRRAVEQLAAEEAGIVIPDYGKTLAEIAKRMSAIVQGQTALAGMPAMQITPEGMAARMEAAAAQARREDRTTLKEARDVHLSAAQAMRAIAGIAHEVREQRRRLCWGTGVGVVVGMLMMTVLPGSIVRALPQNWHMPEAMAAHIMHEPTLWDAGTRLMRAESPRAWAALTQAADMLDDNREAIEACQQSTAKTRKPVRCTIEIKPGS